MDRDLILAIDQGTTNTKVLLVDVRGRVVGSATRAVRRTYPQPGWVEQDPDDLWRSVKDAVHAVLGDAAGPVAAVAITNQRESVMAWERRDGRPVGPCISWQCRRTSDACAELRRRGVSEEISRLTGLPVDPLFSAAKAAWLLDRDGLRRRAEDGEIRVGTVDSWLVWQLTGGASHTIEIGNASRTQLLNLEEGAWDERLLEVFAIPAASLPVVRPSVGLHGTTSGLDGLPAGIPIAAVAADSHAALYGQGCTAPGEVKVTYGTGSSIMSPTSDFAPSRHGLATTIAWQDARVVYAREANITAAGATIEWLAGLLGCPDAEAVSALAQQVADTGGVHLVPAFAGLGAPLWDDKARGIISGLTFGTGRAQVARAGVEAIAFQVRDVLDALGLDDVPVHGALRADGGASRDPLLMQFQADVLGRELHVSAAPDVSALGVAGMAGRYLGWWERRPRTDDIVRYAPSMSEEERRSRHEAWAAAVAKASESDAALGRRRVLDDVAATGTLSTAPGG